MTRISSSVRLSAIVVLAALALFTACDDSSVLNPPQEQNVAGGTTNPGIQFMPNPVEIVIDTTDPNTPTDPITGLFIGKTDFQAMVTDPAGDPVPDVEVVLATEYGLLESDGNPLTTDAEGKVTDTLAIDEDAPATFNVTATSAELNGVVPVNVTVIYPNNPPVADAGESQVIECTSPEGTPVMLDGSGSSDADSTEGTNDDIVEFEWFQYYGTPEEMLLGKGEMLNGMLKEGEYTITLRVTDTAGDTDTDETMVTIEDTTAPQVYLSLDPSMIWPPNHKWVDVHATLDVMDACSVPEDFAITLLSVTSNEPPNANGDGNTEPDIMGAEIGTEDYDFMVRAERAGGGSGRVYTAVYEVSDGENEPQVLEARAVVPHDQGGY